MTAALIITAGKTRHKNTFEPQKEVGTISAIQRIARLFQIADIERIVVVCSENGDKTEKLVPKMNLIFLHNPTEAEMLDNVKAGLAYLKDKCSEVLIAHVNVPLFSLETIHALIGAVGPICIPSHHGQGGHPVLLRTESFHKILSYTGTDGLAGAIKASGLHRNMVAVEDEGILTNIKHSESCARLMEENDLAKLHPEFTFRLMKERIFYGPGPHQFLQLIEETGSLADACRYMGISYSKGRKIISNLESQIGYPVVLSQKGGKTGGTTVITEAGRALIVNYNNFCGEAKQYLNKLFKKYF